MANKSPPITRRNVLSTIAVAGVTSCAGCGSESSGSQADSGTQGSEGGNQSQADSTSEESDPTNGSSDFRWQSTAADPGSSRASSVETQFRDLTHVREWRDPSGSQMRITGFAATSERFITSIALRGGSSGRVTSHLLPGAGSGSGQEWSTSRLASNILYFADGHLHVLSGDTYYRLETETGDVVTDFEPASILEDEFRGILLVDEQHVYMAISGGIAAVDYSSDPASVSWTNSELGHGVGRAIRVGDRVVASRGNSNGSPGMTILSIDSGQIVAARGPQADGGPDLGNISTGEAGMYAYRFNDDQNNKSLVRVNPEDLSVMWEAEDVVIGGALRPKIAVGNDVVLVSRTQDGLMAAEASDGTTRWSVRGRLFSPSVSANAAYVYGNRSLFGIDLETGEVGTETTPVVDGTRVLAVAPIPSGVLMVTNETVNLFAGE